MQAWSVNQEAFTLTHLETEDTNLRGRGWLNPRQIGSAARARSKDVAWREEPGFFLLGSRPQSALASRLPRDGKVGGRGPARWKAEGPVAA